MDPIFSRNLDPNSDRNLPQVLAEIGTQILPEIGVTFCPKLGSKFRQKSYSKHGGKWGRIVTDFWAAGRWRDGVFPRYKTTVTGPAGLCFSVAKILIYLGPNSVRNWTQVLAECGVQILTEIGTQFWQKM
jgi:hypothetical protein